MPEEGGSGTATATEPTTDATSGKGSEGSNGSGATPAVEELRDAGKRALEAERTARKEAETELANLTKRIQEFEDRDKSESERNTEKLAALERERDDARRELAETRLSIEVQAEAAKAGAKYPDAIVRLVNPADVDRDKSGKARNLEELVGSVRDRYPDLFKGRAGRGDVNGGTQNPDAGADESGSDMSSRIRRASGRG